MEEALKGLGVDIKFMPGVVADLTHESMASLIVEDYDVSFVSTLEENLTSGKGNIPAALRQIMPDLDFNELNEEEMIEAILDKCSLDDPIQEIRDKTKIFVNENNVALSTVKCDLQCETCPESRVVLCQMYNQNQIDNYFNQ